MRSATTRSRGTVKVLLLSILASIAPVADAGPGAWTSGGPDGGYVMALAVSPSNPSTLYAGSPGGGIFKSTDGGGTWAAVSTGLTKLRVLALAIDPTKSSTIYAGTDEGGVFRSTDSGGTWASANAGLATNASVAALAIDPTNPATLYAGTWSDGVFKSIDFGVTWAAANTGLGTNDAYALAIDPATPAILYAGTWGGGVFKSTDEGGTWAPARTGLTNLNVLALAVDPATPRTLYAGAFGGGVFKSTDAGGTWTPASSGLTPAYVAALAVDPTTPGTLLAAMLDGGVFKTTDAGGTWAPANAGLTNLMARTLAVCPTRPGTFYAGTAGSGVFVSTDTAGTWSAASTGLKCVDVYALALDSSTGSTLYAGGYGSGVFKSTDSGGTWKAVNTGLTNMLVLALATDPSNPATLYAGTEGGGLFKSTNAGGTWAPANAGLTKPSVYSVVLDPSTPTTLYAGTLGGGVFKSTDSGGTWKAFNTGLTSPYVISLAIDPVTPSTLYAATSTSGPVFKSTDSGGTWSVAKSGLTTVSVHTLAIDPSSPGTIYAGSSYGGVLRSTDAGATWGPVNRGLTNPTVHSLVVDPSRPGTVFVGMDSGGLFKSSDSGETWAPVNAGLPLAAVRALAFDPGGATTLYAGLGAASVWQATAPTVSTHTVALLPSSARVAGAGGAFYTTDLTVANTGATPTTFVLKFLGNNGNGRGGVEKSFPIAAGASTTFSDVLGSVFERTSDFGAIRVTSPSDSIRVLAQTSTPGFGGTFGQSVPAARPEDLVIAGMRQSILAVREDASFRTNLILANATEEPLDVEVSLVADTGVSPPSASRHFALPPLGMTQVTRVVRELGVTGDVSGARLVLSVPYASGSFAAYASVIDNVTNDPRTLLPIGPIVSGRPSPDTWLLPSSARKSGAGGAFYTTDLTVAYTNWPSARYTLKFLGNNGDGRSGPETTFDLVSGKSATYGDVLGSVFKRDSDFGAIRVSSQFPASDSGFLAVLAQTSTRGFGGSFGQSVPAATAADLIRSGTERSILAVREDDAFRTNLILANATEAVLDVDVRLVSADAAVLATKRYPLAPLGMTQVTKVVRDLGLATNVAGARLVLSTPTANGAFAAYASVIDNVTNDPRTLLPR